MHMNTYMKSSTKVNIENQLPQQVIDFWGSNSVNICKKM